MIMNISEFYFRFCKLFHNSKLPGIKFKDLDSRTNSIYKNYFNLDYKDVNKATFVLFLLINLIFLLLSIIIIDLEPILLLFISFIISLLISYWFNTKIYRVIKKNETRINAILHLVKIYYSLIQKSLDSNSDKVIAFISLINEFNTPIARSFNEVSKYVQEGEQPERLIDQIITFSEDFDNYLKELLLNAFEMEPEKKDLEGSAERDFKVFIRQIESRLSIIFFIGTFFPIGMCFLLLFQMMNSLILLFILPLYFFSLKIIYNRSIRKDLFLLGLMKNYSKTEKQKFNEFLSFLRRFSLNLKRGISPETAFIDTFSQLKHHVKLLYGILNRQSRNLINITVSFSEMIKLMKSETNSPRYSIILDVIEKLTFKNSQEASFKISEILDLLYQHKKLEKKLETIFKGEKFKALLFLYILPLILGSIGGIFPSFFLLLNNIDIQYNLIQYLSLNQDLDLEIGIIFIFVFLLLCLVISSNYFLKIIYYERKSFLILISVIFYFFLFIISFLNTSNLI